MARILIMEDDEAQASIWADALMENHHDVVVTENATRAWDALLDDRFDLLIADIFVRSEGQYVADGGTLLIGRIKAFAARHGWERLGDLPILAVSGGYSVRGGYDPLRTSRDQGADDWLKKPFELDELLARVDRLLRLFERSPAVV